MLTSILNFAQCVAEISLLGGIEIASVALIVYYVFAKTRYVHINQAKRAGKPNKSFAGCASAGVGINSCSQVQLMTQTCWSLCKCEFVCVLVLVFVFIIDGQSAVIYRRKQCTKRRS